MGSDPVGPGRPLALVVSAAPGDAARRAIGRLLPGHAQVLTVLAADAAGAAERGLDQQLATVRRDEAAMRVLGVPCIRLPGRPDATLLGRYLDGCGEVWLPAALGRDPGEFAARSAGILAAAAAAQPVQVWLYADGLPADDRPDASVPGDAAVEQLTKRLARAVWPLRPQPHLICLDESARAVRRAVLACYQEPADQRGAGTGQHEDIGVELAWQLAGTGAAGGGCDAGR